MLYVASRVKHAGMWKVLRNGGLRISSSWIDEAGQGHTADMGELWGRIIGEVNSSFALLLYAEPDDFPLKGALVEVGAALAFGIPVFAVLPGVHLDESYRPVGSWVCHPGVGQCSSIKQALAIISRHCPSVYDRPTSK